MTHAFAPMKTAARLLGAAVLLVTAAASAQGYALQQYEPSAAGDGTFSVPSPWYSKAPRFATALTLNEGHNPLLGGTETPTGFQGRPLIEHQFGAHFDATLSFLNRFQASLSLPMTFMEAGSGGLGVSPSQSATVGDPRLGFMMRALGDAQRDAVSLHLGVAGWVPVGGAASHAGDSTFRWQMRAVAAGSFLSRFAWSTDVGFLFRKEASLNGYLNGPGLAGNTLRAGASLSYLGGERWRVGPELTAATVVNGRAFRAGASSLEALVGGQYSLTRLLHVGGGVGFGLIRTAGTPDVRVLLRVAYGGAEADEPAPLHVVHEPLPAPVVAQAPAPAPVVVEPAPGVVAEPAPVVAAAPVVPEPVAPPAPVAAAPVAPVTPLQVRVLFSSASVAAEKILPRELEGLRATLEAHPELKVQLEGHCDSTGTAAANMALSKRRAASVAEQLVKAGIARSRIVVTGKGSESPLQPGDSFEARAANRRVEISWVPSGT